MAQVFAKFAPRKLSVGEWSRDDTGVGFCDATTGVIRAHPFEVFSTFVRRMNESDRLQLNQAAAGSIRDRFSPADDVELGENAFHVRLHCALTNKEGGTDLLVAFALGHQLEHIDLPLA